MTYTIDIIRKNIDKLEDAKKSFPDILGRLSDVLCKYRKTSDYSFLEEANKLKTKANSLRLNSYVIFIEWIEQMSEPIIYDEEITFEKLKETMIVNCDDISVADFLKKKTKKGLINILNSEEYLYLSGRKRKRIAPKSHGRRILSRNFLKCESMIINFLIQNEVKINSEVDMIFYHYKYELNDFESSAVSELNITKEIIKSIEKKIKSMKFDFKKLNLSILEQEIKSNLIKKMLNVDKGEKVKCLEAKEGILTLNKLYDVIEYKIGNSGTLIVRVNDDINSFNFYNYCMFEGVTKFRTDRIDDILSNLE